MRILVTGAAGFIGANLILRLIHDEPNAEILGIDNLNDYYDVSIKEFRLARIAEACKSQDECNWQFVKGNIADKQLIAGLFAEFKPEIVVNLAARPVCATLFLIPMHT